MTAYDTAVLTAIASAPDYVGWYKIEQRLATIALEQRDQLSDALKRLVVSGCIEESQTERGKYQATRHGRDVLATPERRSQCLQPVHQRAWLFTTTVIGREEINKVLEKLAAKPWELYDSDTRPDFLSGWVTPDASLALVSAGKNCVATLSVVGDAEIDGKIEDAKRRVFGGILPAIGARDIQETVPHRSDDEAEVYSALIQIRKSRGSDRARRGHPGRRDHVVVRLLLRGQGCERAARPIFGLHRQGVALARETSGLLRDDGCRRHFGSRACARSATRPVRGQHRLGLVRRMFVGTGIEPLRIRRPSWQHLRSARSCTTTARPMHRPLGRVVLTFNGEIGMVDLVQERGTKLRGWRATLPSETWNNLILTLHRYEFPKRATLLEPPVPGSISKTISWQRRGQLESVEVIGRSLDYADVNRIVWNVVAQMAPGVLSAMPPPFPGSRIEMPMELQQVERP